MEHVLGYWEDSRGPINDGKGKRSCSMHDSVVPNSLYSLFFYFEPFPKTMYTKWAVILRSKDTLPTSSTVLPLSLFTQCLPKHQIIAGFMECSISEVYVKIAKMCYWCWRKSSWNYLENWKHQYHIPSSCRLASRQLSPCNWCSILWSDFAHGRFGAGCEDWSGKVSISWHLVCWLFDTWLLT